MTFPLQIEEPVCITIIVEHRNILIKINYLVII